MQKKSAFFFVLFPFICIFAENLNTITMEIKNNKSTWAALATLGVTAVAAGATAFFKIREKRKERQAAEADKAEGKHLTAEQMMVYNEAISNFIALNDRIYTLRSQRETLQPLVRWLATNGERPVLDNANDDIKLLAADIERFLQTQVPFINACLISMGDPALIYPDCVRGAVGGSYDDMLDEEPTGAQVEKGQKIAFVLRLGYYFPESTLVSAPVKSIVLA